VREESGIIAFCDAIGGGMPYRGCVLVYVEHLRAQSCELREKLKSKLLLNKQLLAESAVHIREIK